MLNDVQFFGFVMFGTALCIGVIYYAILYYSYRNRRPTLLQKAYVICSPSDKMILETIRPTEAKCWQDAEIVLFLSGTSLRTSGYHCAPITIRREKCHD